MARCHSAGRSVYRPREWDGCQGFPRPWDPLRRRPGPLDTAPGVAGDLCPQTFLDTLDPMPLFGLCFLRLAGLRGGGRHGSKFGPLIGIYILLKGTRLAAAGGGAKGLLFSI